MAERKRVDQRQQEWKQRGNRGVEQAPAPYTEKQNQRQNCGERTAGHEPEEIAFESPCLAGRVVGAVRFGEPQLVI